MSLRLLCSIQSFIGYKFSNVVVAACLDEPKASAMELCAFPVIHATRHSKYTAPRKRNRWDSAHFRGGNAGRTVGVIGRGVVVAALVARRLRRFHTGDYFRDVARMVVVVAVRTLNRQAGERSERVTNEHHK